MKRLIILAACLALVACAGLSWNQNFNDQFDAEGQENSFLVTLQFGVGLSPEMVEKLPAEAIERIYAGWLAILDKHGLPQNFTFEPHLEFHQKQGTESATEGELRAQLKALVAKEIRDLAESGEVDFSGGGGS